MSSGSIVVGLDIGTTKIAAVVGQVDQYGKVNIVGVGQHPSQGLRRGVVINIDKTVESIQRAVEQAELLCGQKITKVYAPVDGSANTMWGSSRNGARS